jgi:hypothetical protein
VADSPSIKTAAATMRPMPVARSAPAGRLKPCVSHVCSPLIEKLKEWSIFWVNSGDSLILDPQVGRRHCQGCPCHLSTVHRQQARSS